MNPSGAALSFIERINAHDVEGLMALMTEDHVFTDSLGQSIQGRKWMRPAWESYFSFCPDYWIAHEQVIESGDTVAIFGAAGGTLAGQHWRIPAAWKAVIREGRIQRWQVYADNKPVYDILAQHPS